MWLTAKSFTEVTPHCECDSKGVCANSERKTEKVFFTKTHTEIESQKEALE